MAKDNLPESTLTDEIPEESVDVSPEAAVTESEVTESAITEPEAPRKPQWNIYVVMLLIAFLFLSAGCLMLWTELNRYGFNWRPVG